jgi:transcriptional regulator with XRE-family HTH domain
MNIMDEVDYFLAALRKRVRKDDRGAQSNLAADAHLSEGYVSQLINEKRNCPSHKAMVKIAEALKTNFRAMVDEGMGLSPADTSPAEPKAATPISDEWKDKYIACMEDLIEAKKEIERLRGAAKPLKKLSGTPKRRRGAVA